MVPDKLAADLRRQAQMLFLPDLAKRNYPYEKTEIKRMVLNLPKGHDSFSSVKSTEESVRVSLRMSAAN